MVRTARRRFGRKGMSMRFRWCCRLAAVLALAVALAGVVDGLSPARAQTGGRGDGASQAKEAVQDWARELMRSFPESIKDAPKRDRRISFQPMDPRGVSLGASQRESVYSWMREALNIGWFTFEDPRDHRAVAQAWKNTGVENWFKVYEEVLKKHRTRIHLWCGSVPVTRGIRLDCKVTDTMNPDWQGGAPVEFNREWLYEPRELDAALEAMAGYVVNRLRGDLSRVEIVDKREPRVSLLTKHIAETLANLVVARQAGRPRSSASYELKGSYLRQGDKIDLQVRIDSNGRPVDAVREYVTLASVKDLLEPVRTGEVGETFQDCQVCPEMMVIPAGEYRMGSPVKEKWRGPDESPLHEVRIPGKLAVGRHEVTRREYGAFVKETGRKTAAGCWVGDGSSRNWRLDAARSWRSPGFSQEERHPVVCVSWEDARAYAKWLSKKTDKTYRLLSEAEWEYAARAGTHTSRYWGDGPKGQCKHANGADTAFGKAYGKQAATGFRHAGTAARTPRWSDATGPMRGGCRTCWGTYGNGSRTAGMRTTGERRRTAVPGCPSELARGGSCVAVPGTVGATLLRTAVRGER